jgi:hypothetical protein
MLKVGDRVYISGSTGECMGEILQIESSDRLPQIIGAPDAQEVQKILHEKQIEWLYWIGYRRAGQDLMFVAMKGRDGSFHDLASQEVQLRTVGLG